MHDNNLDLNNYMSFQQLQSHYYSPHSFKLMKNKAALSSQQENLSIFHNNIRSLNLNFENLQSIYLMSLIITSIL